MHDAYIVDISWKVDISHIVDTRLQNMQLRRDVGERDTPFTHSAVHSELLASLVE